MAESTSHKRKKKDSVSKKRARDSEKHDENDSTRTPARSTATSTSATTTPSPPKRRRRCYDMLTLEFCDQLLKDCKSILDQLLSCNLANSSSKAKTTSSSSSSAASIPTQVHLYDSLCLLLTRMKQMALVVHFAGARGTGKSEQINRLVVRYGSVPDELWGTIPLPSRKGRSRITEYRTRLEYSDQISLIIHIKDFPDINIWSYGQQFLQNKNKDNTKSSSTQPQGSSIDTTHLQNLMDISRIIRGIEGVRGAKGILTQYLKEQGINEKEIDNIIPNRITGLTVTYPWATGNSFTLVDERGWERGSDDSCSNQLQSADAIVNISNRMAAGAEIAQLFRHGAFSNPNKIPLLGTLSHQEDKEPDEEDKKKALLELIDSLSSLHRDPSILPDILDWERRGNLFQLLRRNIVSGDITKNSSRTDSELRNMLNNIRDKFMVEYLRKFAKQASSFIYWSLQAVNTDKRVFQHQLKKMADVKSLNHFKQGKSTKMRTKLVEKLNEFFAQISIVDEHDMQVDDDNDSIGLNINFIHSIMKGVLTKCKTHFYDEMIDAMIATFVNKQERRLLDDQKLESREQLSDEQKESLQEMKDFLTNESTFCGQYEDARSSMATFQLQFNRKNTIDIIAQEYQAVIKEHQVMQPHISTTGCNTKSSSDHQASPAYKVTTLEDEKQEVEFGAKLAQRLITKFVSQWEQRFGELAEACWRELTARMQKLENSSTFRIDPHNEQRNEIISRCRVCREKTKAALQQENYHHEETQNDWRPNFTNLPHPDHLHDSLKETLATARSKSSAKSKKTFAPSYSIRKQIIDVDVEESSEPGSGASTMSDPIHTIRCSLKQRKSGKTELVYKLTKAVDNLIIDYRTELERSGSFGVCNVADEKMSINDQHHAPNKLLFPIVTPLYAQSTSVTKCGTGHGSSNPVDSLLHAHVCEQYNGMQHLVFFLVEPTHEKVIRQLVANQADSSNKILVILPSDQLVSAWTLDIGRQLMIKYEFSFAWRISMNLVRIKELQPVVLQTSECNRSRALYSLQYVVLDLWNRVKLLLAERLQPGQPTYTNLLYLAGKTSLSQQEHTRLITICTNLTQNGATRLKVSVTDVNFLLSVVQNIMSTLPETMKSDLSILSSIVDPYQSLGMVCVSHAKRMLEMFLPHYPEYHNSFQGTVRAYSLVLDHTDALKEKSFVACDSKALNQSQFKEALSFDRWLKEMVKMEKKIGSKKSANNTEKTVSFLCTGFGAESRVVNG